MMQSGPQGHRLAVVLAFTTSMILAGCANTVTPKPSAAIQAVRTRSAVKAQAAPPCPAPATAEKRVVLFAFQDAALDQRAKAELNSVAGPLVCDPGLRISLTAEADYHGSPGDQQALIAARLAAIRAYLTAAGVADAQLAPSPTPSAGAPAGWTLLARGRDW
jgi:outer membrane protein OmpA-like peptidoglycan-associated protein